MNREWTWTDWEPDDDQVGDGAPCGCPCGCAWDTEVCLCIERNCVCVRVTVDD